MAVYHSVVKISLKNIVFSFATMEPHLIFRLLIQFLFSFDISFYVTGISYCGIFFLCDSEKPLIHFQCQGRNLPKRFIEQQIFFMKLSWYLDQMRYFLYIPSLCEQRILFRFIKCWQLWIYFDSSLAWCLRSTLKWLPELPAFHWPIEINKHGCTSGVCG